MEKPFIQLFKTPRSQYIFDVNSNKILPVSEDVFTFLYRCMNGEADVRSSNLAEIQNLIQEGYLGTESAVKEIQHPYTQRLEYFLGRKIRKITLQLTQSCNLRCKYCIYSENSSIHQRTHSSKRMDWETVKKGIDFLWEHSIDSPKVNIGFYGGEPLLEYPLIKQAVAYAKELFDGKKLTFAITTNGTLLTDEIIDFFVQENIFLVISLDGPKEIHDKSRVFATGEGSFDTVIKNVERIKERAPGYAKQIGYSMVMDPSNDYDCINEITVSSSDMNEHTFLASIVDRDYDEEEAIYSEEYSWKYQYQRFLGLLSLFNRYPEDKVSAILRRSINRLLHDVRRNQSAAPLRMIDAPSGPCVPGQMRLFINAEGNLFPCERVSESSGVMCIGSLETGFDFKKISNLLNIGEITEDSCKRCWSFRHCSLCAKKADDGSGELSARFKLTHCRAVQSDTYFKLRQLILLDEISLYYADQIRI